MTDNHPWVFGTNPWRAGFAFTVGDYIYIQVWRWTAQRERVARWEQE